MFICLCRAISQKKLLTVIQEGAKTVEDVTARCGAGGDCGSCKMQIASMLTDGRNAHAKNDSSCPASSTPVDAAL